MRGERLQDKSEEQNSKPYMYTNWAHANYCILLTMSTFAITICITQLITCPPPPPPHPNNRHTSNSPREKQVSLWPLWYNQRMPRTRLTTVFLGLPSQTCECSAMRGIVTAWLVYLQCLLLQCTYLGILTHTES